VTKENWLSGDTYNDIFSIKVEGGQLTVSRVGSSGGDGWGLELAFNCISETSEISRLVNGLVERHWKSWESEWPALSAELEEKYIAPAKDELQSKLTAFYTEHNPDGLQKVENLVEEHWKNWKSTTSTLLTDLEEKYITAPAKDELRAKLTAFYTEHNPGGLRKVGALVEKYWKNWHSTTLFADLEEEYAESRQSWCYTVLSSAFAVVLAAIQYVCETFVWVICSAASVAKQLLWDFTFSFVEAFCVTVVSSVTGMLAFLSTVLSQIWASRLSIVTACIGTAGVCWFIWARAEAVAKVQFEAVAKAKADAVAKAKAEAVAKAKADAVAKAKAEAVAKAKADAVAKAKAEAVAKAQAEAVAKAKQAWEFEDGPRGSAKWVRYSDELCRKLEINQQTKSIVEFTRHSVKYTVEFRTPSTAEQTNCSTEFKRAVRRRAEGVCGQLGGNESRDKATENDVLHYYRHRSINDLLAAQSSFQISEVTPNPHSKPGEWQYDRFFAAWNGVKNQTIKLGFHGTAEANIDAICRDGLDPARRAGQACGPGEYFATQMQTSVPYCKGGHKMLVMALLVDETGLTAYRGGFIVVNKVEHQLPLFTFTFKDSRV
jgi:hypothetical protein